MQPTLADQIERMRELLDAAEYDNASAAHAIDEALKVLEKLQIALDVASLPISVTAITTKQHDQKEGAAR